MNIFIYFFGPTGYGLDEIEDAIEAELRCRGEVTGAGTGQAGANIDIEITDKHITPEKALYMVRSALRDFNLPASTRIEIDDTKHGLVGT
jgi:hypothetical protein